VVAVADPALGGGDRAQDARAGPRRSSPSADTRSRATARCLGILRLGKRYGNERLEAACARAVAAQGAVLSARRVDAEERPRPSLRAGAGSSDDGHLRQPREHPAVAATTTTEGRACADGIAMEKLRLLRLDALAAAWAEQQKNPETQKLAFDERLGMLVDAQWLSCENKRLVRALKEAKLKLGNACLEDIDYPPRRELEKAVIRQLATCRWVEEHQNVVLTGSTGTGKTYLACALAQQACRKGYRAIYRRATRLTDELTLARADGTYAQLLGRFARADVLVIDDWGLAPVKDQERRDLLEVMEDRYGTRSTAMTSQTRSSIRRCTRLPTAKWHDYLGDPTMADAICDRLLRNAQRIALKGPSRRKEDSATDK
jgi:DNA replication protein DnaC